MTRFFSACCFTSVVTSLVFLAVARTNAMGGDDNGRASEVSGSQPQPADQSGGTTRPTDAATNPTASATTQASTEPSPVTGIARSTAWIKLKWKPVGGNVYYQVFRGSSADFQPDYFSEISPALSIPSFDDVRVAAGKAYYYKVIVVQSSPPFPSKEIGAVSVTTPVHDEPLRALKEGEEN
jgi:hypothetical protein